MNTCFLRLFFRVPASDPRAAQFLEMGEDHGCVKDIARCALRGIVTGDGEEIGGERLRNNSTLFWNDTPAPTCAHS